MTVTPAKLIALLIAAAWEGAEIAQAGHVTPEVVKTALGLVVPLVLIWFPDQLGSFSGYVGRGGNIDSPTPGPLIAAFGWFILLGVPVIMRLLP